MLMSDTIGHLLSDRRTSPLWKVMNGGVLPSLLSFGLQVEGKVLSAWQHGQGSDRHLLVATEVALYRLNMDCQHNVMLHKFSGKVTATHVLSNRLTVLQHPFSCDEKTPKNCLRIELLDLATLMSTTVASLPMSSSSPSPTWLLVLPRNHLSSQISKLVDRLVGDKVYFIGGYGTQTLASTEASDQTITVGFSVRGSWQFLQKHMAKPHALGNVTSFSELGATLTQRGITSENCGHRGLLDVIEFSDKTFILTACNNLWEGGRLLLGTVGGIETVGGVLVAWTFNGGIYIFNDQFRSNSSASLLPTLPGFEGKGGLVKEVTAAAKEVARMGKEEEKRREEIDQMRLATVMMGDMAVFDQKVKVTFGYGEGRGLQLELTNTSGQDLKGELWKVNLEVGPCNIPDSLLSCSMYQVRSLQGSTWTHNLPLPACLLPLGRLSFHLPLPKLLPGESPLRIATKLIFTGASYCSMVATRILATNQVSFFELLHIDVISQSSTNFSHLQFNSGNRNCIAYKYTF